MKKRDARGALEHLRAAVRLKPGFAPARNNLAWVLESTGDFQGAEAECRQAMALAQGDPIIDGSCKRLNDEIGASGKLVR